MISRFADTFYFIALSFVVMQGYGITEALTGDSHFAQAEFVPLMR